MQPGTKMPTYFPLADDDDPTSHATPFTKILGGSVKAQIEALIQLNMEVRPTARKIADAPADPR